jgi:hypothetical protein
MTRVVTRFKQPRRIIDPSVFAMMVPVRRCPLCGTRRPPLGFSRHHILPTAQGGDDVLANLMWVCGQGANGCHGLIHAHDTETCQRVRAYLHRERSDTIAYLYKRLPELGRNPRGWLDRRYPRGH